MNVMVQDAKPVVWLKWKNKDPVIFFNGRISGVAI